MSVYQNKVYLASPFFSDGQKDRINQVVELLKQNPTIESDGIFIPQITNLSPNLSAASNGKTPYLPRTCAKYIKPTLS